MMRKKKIEINYLEFDDMKDITEQDQQLLMHAREAGKNAYAPYSEFRVGAAVLLETERYLKEIIRKTPRILQVYVPKELRCFMLPPATRSRS